MLIFEIKETKNLSREAGKGVENKFLVPFLQIHSKSETVVAVFQLWVVVAAVGYSATAAGTCIATTTQHTFFAIARAFGVFLRLVFIFALIIATPFPHVAAHIV